MRNLLRKEMWLSASKLSFLFIGFGLVPFFPGYPILVGAFFVCLGIFQSFQAARENGDILYSALLPIAKKDIVKAKYLFCVWIEGCAFLLMTAVTLLRMTVLVDAAPYRQNALMNANLVFLGLTLVIFGCFNAVFVGGFFKTAYYFAKPFVAFIVVCFLIVGAGETLHHIPGCGAFNAFGWAHLGLQCASLAIGTVIFAFLTVVSVRIAIKRFNKIDL